MGTRSNRLGEAVRTSTHNLCFEQKYEKYQNFYLKTFSFWWWNFQYIWIGVFSYCWSILSAFTPNVPFLDQSTVPLTLNTSGKIFSRRSIFFFNFLQETGFPVETICMKCHILFSGKNTKTIINSSSTELAKRVVNVNFFPSSGFREVSYIS